MASMIKAAFVIASLAGLGACTSPPSEPFAARSLPKGERLDVRALLAAHPDQSACVDYEAESDSCASVITTELTGGQMLSRESGLVGLPEAGAAQRVEIVTRSTVQNGQACAQAQDVTTGGRDEISGFLMEIKRDLITQAGGTVCASYFRSGDRYVVSPIGADGRPFAQGDSYLRFVDGPAKLRVK